MNKPNNLTEITLPHGTVKLPAFFPDGTSGVVRCLDSADLENCGVSGLVMNTYHLMAKPGQSVIKSLGGLNSFINWQRPIITDSGGFQVFSLIRENAKFGEIQPEQIVFRADNKKVILTPEKCIQSQFAYGSDVMMCLDYCTHPDDPPEINRQAVDITIKWAERCTDEYMRRCKPPSSADGTPFQKGAGASNRPLLFGIIQGGGSFELRKECADALIDIGFDGFGFGGWPLDSNGELVEDILAYTASLMPAHSVKYAMGLGKPEGIVACVRMGYNLFDCVIPTREARHNRLYVFSEDYASPDDIDVTGVNAANGGFYKYYYLLDDKYRRDSRPVSAICDCWCCRNYSRAYLRHLNVIGDSLGNRLATIHNLRFYTMLMERLRGD